MSLCLLQHKAHCSLIFNLQIERRKTIHLNKITLGGDCICIILKEMSQSCLHQVFLAGHGDRSTQEMSSTILICPWMTTLRFFCPDPSRQHLQWALGRFSLSDLLHLRDCCYFKRKYNWSRVWNWSRVLNRHLWR